MAARPAGLALLPGSLRSGTREGGTERDGTGRPRLAARFLDRASHADVQQLMNHRVNSALERSVWCGPTCNTLLHTVIPARGHLYNAGPTTGKKWSRLRPITNAFRAVRALRKCVLVYLCCTSLLRGSDIPTSLEGRCYSNIHTSSGST